MQGLKTPANFSFNPEEWPAWIQEFRRYRNASKLAKEDGEIQRDTLLYIMGRESEKVFQTFRFETRMVTEGEEVLEERETDTDFETLVRKFDAYFIVKRNIIHERTKVQERKQAENESIEQYYRSLRALVVYCEYADMEDQVRDRFVVGLRDIKLKEKLQLIHDLTLSRALEIARQHEQIKKQIRDQQNKANDLSHSDETRRNFPQARPILNKSSARPAVPGALQWCLS